MTTIEVSKNEFCKDKINQEPGASADCIAGCESVDDLPESAIPISTRGASAIYECGVMGCRNIIVIANQQ